MAGSTCAQGEKLMSAIIEVPIKVDADAAERVAQMGLQAALERMLDYAKANVPGILGIHVLLEYNREFAHEPPVIFVEVSRNETVAWSDETSFLRRWADWRLANLTAEARVN